MSRFIQPPDERASTVDASPSRSPLTFCVLVFLLSLPFWLIGAVTRIQLFSGLPIAAVAVVCPMTAAAILIYNEAKGAGAAALLKRCFDYNRISDKIWYAPIVLLMPCVTLISYGLLHLSGNSLPAPQISVPSALILFLLFLVGAACEEIGWSAYATDPLQERSNAFQAGVLLGLIWAVWHFVPLIQAHRTPTWIAWWSLFTVALRILIVWIYNNTGKSVFATALFHAMSNVCTVLLPAYFDLIGPILAVVAAAVVVIWGPRSLTRYTGP